MLCDNGIIKRTNGGVTAETEPISSSGTPSTGEKSYKIYITNKEPTWLVYDWSCGSGGCSASFAIYYNLSVFTKEKI